MTDEIESLLSKYFLKGILVDTNILLLLFVGEANKDRITRFPRTEQFRLSDYDLLVDLLRRFKTIATTPNILTEVNSLINQLGEPDRSMCYEVFATRLPSLEETYLPSKEVASLEWHFLSYGLTDCSMAELAQNRYLVLTDDLKATSYLLSQGIDVVNFNNLRSDYMIM